MWTIMDTKLQYKFEHTWLMSPGGGSFAIFVRENDGREGTKNHESSSEVTWCWRNSSSLWRKRDRDYPCQQVQRTHLAPFRACLILIQSHSRQKLLQLLWRREFLCVGSTLRYDGSEMSVRRLRLRRRCCGSCGRRSRWRSSSRHSNSTVVAVVVVTATAFAATHGVRCSPQRNYDSQQRIPTFSTPSYRKWL